MDYSKDTLQLIMDVEKHSVLDFFCKLRKKKYKELTIEELRLLAIICGIELPHSVINLYLMDYEKRKEKRKATEHLEALIQLRINLPFCTTTAAIAYFAKESSER
jgi:hypothetical protein